MKPFENGFLPGVERNAAWRARKAALVISMVIAMSSGAFAQEGKASRTITLYAAGMSSALPATAEEALFLGTPGYSGSIRMYQSFNPKMKDGFYWYVAGTRVARQIGGVTIGDVHLAGSGWRGEILKGLSLDLGASAVAGSRIEDRFITVDIMAGVSPLAGFSIAINDTLDIGIMVEPVFMLYPFDSAFIPTRSYIDVSLFVAVKSYVETKALKWKQ